MKHPIKILILTAVLILIVAFSWNGIRQAFFPELEAERLIHKYYEAIIDEEYDKAYQYLYIYDREHIDELGSISAGTSLSEVEAKQFYQQKIAFLKQQDYRLEDYRIVGVEYADGHTFWHNLELVVYIDGKTHYLEETVHIQNEQLMIGKTEDSNAPYRDGEMNIVK
jgi:hypothetical protein